jgi:hypothetical protein
MEGRHDEQEQGQRQADAPGQGAHRALAPAAVAHQVVEGLAQAGEDKKDNEEHEDFHGIRPDRTFIAV